MEKGFSDRIKYLDYSKLNPDDGVFLYTDGSTWNNGQKDPNHPCIGGWGFVITESGEEVQRGSGGEMSTSISRMELLGVISGLSKVKELYEEGTKVTVVSDSQYVIRGATEYMRGWLKRGWKNNQGQSTANIDLWKKLVKLSNASNVLSYGSYLDVYFSWVRGHKGHIWNEACDVMAGGEKDCLLEIYRSK
jgi:ribonuclease HI